VLNSAERGKEKKSGIMLTRTMLRRIEKVEQRAAQVANARSRSSPGCICFPEKEQPFFVFPTVGDMAFLVKCPLHGDRFKWPVPLMYVAQWRFKNELVRRQRFSVQYQKAWATNFPPHLWPAEEENTEEATYLRLKDGTRLLAYEFASKKKKGPESQTSTSGSTETTEATWLERVRAWASGHTVEPIERLPWRLG
jgi:hypothetical protein